MLAATRARARARTLKICSLVGWNGSYSVATIGIYYAFTFREGLLAESHSRYIDRYEIQLSTSEPICTMSIQIVRMSVVLVLKISKFPLVTLLRL